jgi:hypothetical protein
MKTDTFLSIFYAMDRTTRELWFDSWQTKCFLNSVGVHPASYSVDFMAILFGVKQPGREAKYSPLSSAEEWHAGSYT